VFEYLLELYFYKDSSKMKHKGLQKFPSLDEYKKETKTLKVKTWEVIQNEILRRFPDVAYILIQQKNALASLEDEYYPRYETEFLKIKESNLHGAGVFAAKDYEKGELLFTLGGELVSMKGHSSQYPPGEWNAVSKDLYLIRPDRTIYGFVNHSRDANAVIDYHDFTVRTLCTILKGDEVTIDYRREALTGGYLSGHGATYL